MAAKVKRKEITPRRAVTSQETVGSDFAALVGAIRQVHEHCAVEAGKAVNIALSLRNWVVGFFICEYEQKGSDRAAYPSRRREDPDRHEPLARVV
jgi:hypothetical protein